ncbi:hypothetical protein BDP81DRAFT_442034 [Colletotrichum phormii]|uniref:Uncharacterized protein n=1 Tax=Colletotrichum phormii TaxID=359342 RepID=A0AAJ0E7Y3_9PEZI|nr:uncharacterized protein BDP81DRAFT_442034 [Colletotrichum phormii]KAK1622199.1 hypothetical protein BDP81DRAFT_442034 [Colletotrichum phormii]
MVEFLQRSRSARPRIPLKHQRYWLARSYADFDTQLRWGKHGRDADRNFLFRFLHTTEQAEPHDISASGPGLARLCEQMMDMWKVDINDRPSLKTIWLVSQVWARAFLAVPTTLSPPSSREFYLFTACHEKHPEWLDAYGGRRPSRDGSGTFRGSTGPT